MAAALRAAGASVEVHDEHFPPDAADEHWLRLVGQHGWVVLTKDQRIRQRTTELAALARADVRAFVLTAGELRGSEMGAVFARALPRMSRLAERQPPPFVARVSRSGAVALLLTAGDLRRRGGRGGPHASLG